MVTGAGLNIGVMLTKHGAVAGEPCAAIMVAIEAGKVKGSSWLMEGNLGTVVFSTVREEGHRNLNVEVNLDNLSRFVFPTDSDPRHYSNLSNWTEGVSLVTRLKDGSQDLTDPEDIKKHSLFQDGKAGFGLRLTVLPLAMGKVTV